MLQLDKKITFNKDVIDAPNLTDRFSEDDLDKIGEVVWNGYNRDLRSRNAWERRMEAGLNLAMQVAKEKTYPWPGASNVIFPLVTIAALQFSARAYTNIIPGTEVYRFRVLGNSTDDKVQEAADRISKHMSWQCLEEDMGWEEQHDRLLINLAIVGTNFVKSYYSPILRHNVSELVIAKDFVLDYYAKSVESCARKTQRIPLYRNEIYENVYKDLFHDVLDEEWYTAGPKQIDEGRTQADNRKGVNPPVDGDDEDAPYITLEQHRFFDFDGDGYAEPYVVTIDENSHKTLRIVARTEKEEHVERTASKRISRIVPTEYYTKYSFIPSPDGGIYDIGFGVLLGPINEAVNTGINQILDAGTMANSSGGFLGRGAKIRGGVYAMAPWTWKRVDSTGDDLRKSLVQLPVRDPSNVMYQIISLLISYTDRVAGTTDTLVGENPGQNTPAETSRNMTEQGMKVYNVIHKRVWRSMKEEGKKLYQLNATYLIAKHVYGEGGQIALREDYASNADLIVPAADPNMTSDGQRIQQAAAMAQRAMMVPGYDIEVVEKIWLRALRIENIDKVYPGPKNVPPLPNPKMQVEQLKLQGHQLKFQFEKWKTITQLMADRKKIQAEIVKLNAEAMAITAGISADEKAHRLATFNSVVTMLEKYNDALTDRIEAMKGDGDEGGNDSGGKGGGAAKGTQNEVPRLEGPPSDGGSVQAPPQMAGGDTGAMGGGGV